MSASISKIFEIYVAKNPSSSKNDIVDMMLNDGVIDYETAKKIKSGMSLFLIDHSFELKDCKSQNYAQIFGADFSTTKKDIPKTNFNREIEPTKQAEGQIDCWLLSGINALNTTSWGKKAIFNAIVPDSDDGGGVTIKLPGSPIEQKNFHVSAEEIAKAKESGEFSSGDDDMIAIELAVEKLFKIMDKEHLGEINRNGAETNSYLGNMVVEDEKGEKRTLDVEELITGNACEVVPFFLSNVNKNEYDKIYQYVSQNHNNMAITLTITNKKDVIAGRDKNDLVHGNHSYAIKDFVYGKYVIVSDPYNSGEDIKLSWQKFLSEETILFFTFENGAEQEKFKKVMPKDFSQRQTEYYKEKHAVLDEMMLPYKVEKEKAEQERLANIEKMNWTSIENLFGKDKLKNELITDTMTKNVTDTNCINKDNVIKVFEKYGFDIISRLDKAAYGFGNGGVKKALMTPIINAITEKAQGVGIQKEVIDKFNQTCQKELNAWFYTDEKIIQSEVEKMVKLIKNKENAVS
jgi:hypothetical protein